MLLRRKTAARPSLLALRALWLMLREKKHRVAVSGTGKLALEKLFCAVAAELVHGLEKKRKIVLRERGSEELFMEWGCKGTVKEKFEMLTVPGLQKSFMWESAGGP